MRSVSRLMKFRWFCFCDLYELRELFLTSREDGRVSHYIINKVVHPDSATRYRIGDQMFPDLPTLLGFYRLHYLDTTPLIRPLVYSAPPVPVLETVLAKFDFEGTVSILSIIIFSFFLFYFDTLSCNFLYFH